MSLEAVCVLQNQEGKKQGVVIFKQNRKSMSITIGVTGLSPGKHGFHIHKTGDLREGCGSLCAHFNPYNKTHGSRTSTVRHIGDLGNVSADNKGNVLETFRDTNLTILGKHGVLGRSVIVHQDEDDLGRGGDKESLKTGNAGKRVLCGIIGWSKDSVNTMCG